MYVSERISSKVNHMKRGLAFPISDFYKLGTRASVQKTMSRLAKKGVIQRVSKGFYVRPKPLASLPSVTTTTTVSQLAHAWSKEHGYKLVPQGLEEAYRLGFQSQAPVKAVFWSNGPVQQFKIGHEIADVRHVTEKKLRWPNKPEGQFLRAFSVMPSESVSASSFVMAIKRLGLSTDEASHVIKKLKTTALPIAWQNKLNEFDRAISE